MSDYPSPEFSVLSPELMSLKERKDHRRQLDATYSLRTAIKEALESAADFKTEFGNEALIPDPYIPRENELNMPDEPAELGEVPNKLQKSNSLYLTERNFILRRLTSLNKTRSRFTECPDLAPKKN